MLCFLTVIFLLVGALPIGAQSVSAGHPRLLVDSNRLALLRAKAATNDVDWLTLKQRADELLTYAVADYDRNFTASQTITYPYQGFGWLEPIQSLGLAYLVTSNAAYAAKGIEVLQKINAAPGADPVAVDSGFPTRAALFGLGLGYDWFYPALDQALRTNTVATVNRWFDWVAANAFERDGPPYGNYFAGHIQGVGTAALATYYDNPRAPELLNFARSRFDGLFVPATQNGGFAGGYPVESWAYQSGFHRYLAFMIGLRTATGEDLISANPWTTQIVQSLIYHLKPNRWQATDEGDWAGDFTGNISPYLPLLLGGILDNNSEAGSYARFFVENLAKAPVGIPQSLDPSDRFLWSVPGLAQSNYQLTLPPRRYSPGDEHLIVRSDWTDQAVWMSFNGGVTQYADHQARLAGHLALQRGDDYLLVNAGQWKGADGRGGQPQRFVPTCDFGNTLFIDDGGDYLYTGGYYSGGQTYWGDYAPLRHSLSAHLVWAQCDASSSYDRRPDNRDPANRSVQAFVRNFVALQPDLVVLFDRLRVKKSSYQNELRFHLPAASNPTIEGGDLVRAQLGQSRFLLRTLLPAQLAATNDLISGQPATVHIAVSPAAPTNAFDSLALIRVGDLSASLPPASLFTDRDGAFQGLQLRTAGLERILLFAQTVTGRVDVPFQYTVDPIGPSRHAVFNLLPAQGYRVAATNTGPAWTVDALPAANGTNLVSDAAGVLSFDLLITGQIVPVPTDAPPPATSAGSTTGSGSGSSSGSGGSGSGGSSSGSASSGSSTSGVGTSAGSSGLGGTSASAGTSGASSGSAGSGGGSSTGTLALLNWTIALKTPRPDAIRRLTPARGIGRIAGLIDTRGALPFRATGVDVQSALVPGLALSSATHLSPAVPSRSAGLPRQSRGWARSARRGGLSSPSVG